MTLPPWAKSLSPRRRRNSYEKSHQRPDEGIGPYKTALSSSPSSVTASPPCHQEGTGGHMGPPLRNSRGSFRFYRRGRRPRRPRTRCAPIQDNRNVSGRAGEGTRPYGVSEGAFIFCRARCPHRRFRAARCAAPTSRTDRRPHVMCVGADAQPARSRRLIAAPTKFRGSFRFCRRGRRPRWPAGARCAPIQANRNVSGRAGEGTCSTCRRCVYLL